MITLCGMCLSNYYNKVKMVLLEKGIPFEEEFVRTGSKEEAVLSCSPLAKVRELTTFVDLHLELAARELYGKAFFGGDISEANAERVRKLLIKNIAAFKRLAKFSPYVAGDSFTQADCAAFVSLPLVGLASRIVLGEDLLAAAGVDWKAYVKVVGERPSAQRINADRKAEQERLAAK